MQIVPSINLHHIVEVSVEQKESNGTKWADITFIDDTGEAFSIAVFDMSIQVTGQPI